MQTNGINIDKVKRNGTLHTFTTTGRHVLWISVSSFPSMQNCFTMTTLADFLFKKGSVFDVIFYKVLFLMLLNIQEALEVLMGGANQK